MLNNDYKYHYAINNVTYDNMIRTLSKHNVKSFRYCPLPGLKSYKNNNEYCYIAFNSSSSKILKDLNSSNWMPTTGNYDFFVKKGYLYSDIIIKNNTIDCTIL